MYFCSFSNLFGVGIKGRLSRNSLKKLTEDNSAIKKSVSPKLHALAVANIKSLFERATIDVKHRDTKGNRDIEWVHRVGVLMAYQGEIHPVKITLKQYYDTRKGSRLYSVEALSVEKIKSAGQLADAGRTGSQAPIADFNNKIIQLAESVNPDSVSRAVDQNGEPQARIFRAPQTESTFFQEAFHGSPYRFERFDTSLIGKGEGAQMYGWGLYFAGKKEVAEFYWASLSDRQGLFDNVEDRKFSGRTMSEWNTYLNKEASQKNPAEARPILDRLAMLEDLMLNYDYTAVLNEARENGYAPQAIEWFEQTFGEDFQTPGQLSIKWISQVMR